MTCYGFKVLISRDYRGDLPWNCIDKFLPLVLEAEEEGQTTPIVQAEDVCFRGLSAQPLPSPSFQHLRVSTHTNQFFLKTLPGCLAASLLFLQVNFMYIKHENLYVVANSKKNANAALVFVFLHRLVEVCLPSTAAAALVTITQPPRA